jgi:hypothetical protein
MYVDEGDASLFPNFELEPLTENDKPPAEHAEEKHELEQAEPTQRRDRSTPVE